MRKIFTLIFVLLFLAEAYATDGRFIFAENNRENVWTFRRYTEDGFTDEVLSTDYIKNNLLGNVEKLTAIKELTGLSEKSVVNLLGQLIKKNKASFEETEVRKLVAAYLANDGLLYLKVPFSDLKDSGCGENLFVTDKANGDTYVPAAVVPDYTQKKGFIDIVPSFFTVEVGKSRDVKVYAYDLTGQPVRNGGRGLIIADFDFSPDNVVVAPDNYVEIAKNPRSDNASVTGKIEVQLVNVDVVYAANPAIRGSFGVSVAKSASVSVQPTHYDSIFVDCNVYRLRPNEKAICKVYLRSTKGDVPIKAGWTLTAKNMVSQTRPGVGPQEGFAVAYNMSGAQFTTNVVSSADLGDGFVVYNCNQFPYELPVSIEIKYQNLTLLTSVNLLNGSPNVFCTNNLF